ncbi:HDIG domain-containing protein [Candidatus Falkowbacteria bacterium]|nr:HDIG domain-containing protein [Candidatus Falkowbacteria bacterium]
MNPLKIIQKYYNPNSETYEILVTHSKLVTKKALEIAKNVKHLNPDTQFIKESCMLHDIGIFQTRAPGIDCHGKHPYITHAFLGAKILRKEGLPRHARACEKHIGIGLSISEIKKQKLPLPKKNMSPKTIEEKIICFADMFYSKTPSILTKEKTIPQIKKSIAKFGAQKVRKFERWCKLFKIKPSLPSQNPL